MISVPMGDLRIILIRISSAEGETIGAGLAATTTIDGGSSAEVTFSLAWDMPIVRSGYGSAYQRRYSIFFGKSGDAAPKIAAEALKNFRKWEKEINRWQKPILEDQESARMVSDSPIQRTVLHCGWGNTVGLSAGTKSR